MSWGDDLDEAADPTTSAERLTELAKVIDGSVLGRARENPSLPSEVHLHYLEEGDPWAWRNPQTPLTLLLFGLGEKVIRGALQAAHYAWRPTTEASFERFRAQLAEVLDPWWATTTRADLLFLALDRHAASQPTADPYHRLQNLGLDLLEPELLLATTKAGRWMSTARQQARLAFGPPPRPSAFLTAKAVLGDAAMLLDDQRYEQGFLREIRDAGTAEFWRVYALRDALSRIVLLREEVYDHGPTGFITQLAVARVYRRRLEQSDFSGPVSDDEMLLLEAPRLADELRARVPIFPWATANVASQPLVYQDDIPF